MLSLLWVLACSIVLSVALCGMMETSVLNMYERRITRRMDRMSVDMWYYHVYGSDFVIEHIKGDK